MVNRATKLRWRRRVKRSQKHIENISVQAEEGLEQHFFARLNRLVDVGRFTVAWVGLVLFLGLGVVVQTRGLSRYYQELKPADGGIYTEGVLGTFTTANPLYATGAVDSSVARLIFSGLFKYDEQGRLINDLAQSIESDARGTRYTVTLKPDLMWHDGEKVTADDIIFTYATIQNPDAKSPLRSNWQGVKLEKTNDRTVVFVLPHALTAFPHLLTNGIVPEHVLSGVPTGQLRSTEFNTVSPVGTGPFAWESVQIIGQTPETREEHIGLVANERYYDGAPKFDRFIIRAIHTDDRLADQFKSQELDAVASLEARPEALNNHTQIIEHNIPINAEVMVFFKTSQGALQDKNVRQALVKASNTNEVLKGLGYPVIPARSPLLKNHLGYSKDLDQFGPNPEEAKQILEKAGWVIGKNGIREKAGQPLAFQLYSHNNSEYSYVSQVLQKQWRAIGVDAEVLLRPDTDLQSVLAFHTYDALLYGITLGSDPDVYAYWHGSQADIRSAGRLNFSEFQSGAADAALDAARTRSEATTRAAKYRPFLQAWRDEAPALALYQPRLLYITRGRLYGFDPRVVNVATDRYANVHKWQIRTEKVPIQ